MRLLCIIALIGLSSCLRKYDTYKLSDSSKAYFQAIGEGGYLVYGDSANFLDSDTLFVENYSRKFLFEYKDKIRYGNYYEKVNYDLVNRSKDYTLKVLLRSSKEKDIYQLSGIPDGVHLFCAYDLNTQTQQYEYNDVRDTIEQFPSLSLSGYTYQDCMRLTAGTYIYEGHVPTYTHAKNIGLVQFRIYDRVNKVEVTKYLKAYHHN